jgi:phosphatidylserine/phosphatidylglycerophosphate/cardiolipin synthase-like enzyme
MSITTPATTPALAGMLALALAAASMPARVHASPETAVQAVLTSNTWSAEQGKTWERSTNNRVVQIVHTPMDAWGLNPLTLSYNVYDHSGTGGSATDLFGSAEDGSDMRACAAATAVNVKDPGCGMFTSAPVLNQHIARCQTYDIWRKQLADAAQNRCGAQSDKMLDDVWQLVSAARHQVDVTTLFNPTGRFKAALRNSIQYAANQLVGTGGTLTVRVLVGEQKAPPKAGVAIWGLQNWLPGEIRKLHEQSSDPRALAAYLGHGLSPAAAARLKLYVGVYHPSVSVWNHSKIVAVDGTRALVGGHNLWDAFPYFDLTPVHDLSILVEGGAAKSAHKFADQLWATTCSSAEGEEIAGAQTVWTWDAAKGIAATALSVASTDAVTGSKYYACPTAATAPPALPPPNVPFNGTTTVYGIGKLGTWLPNGASGSGRNPADAALAAMIRGASHAVYLSQQNLSGPIRASEQLPSFIGKGLLARATGALADYLGAQGMWTVPVLEAIAGAAANDRSVRIVIADAQAANEYNSSGAKAVLAAIMARWPGRPSTAVKTEAQLACNLEVAYLRSSDDAVPYPAAWTGNGDRLPGNHVKMVIVDPGTGDAGYYVGSQNLYANELAEFGYMVFGQAATNALTTAYWDPAWQYSSRAAQGGLEVHRPAQCVVTNGQAARGVIGQPNLVSAVANNGGVSANALNTPNGVAVDTGTKRLWIADSGNYRVLGLGEPPALPVVVGQADAVSNAAPGAIGSNFGATADGLRIGAANDTGAVADTARNRVIAWSGPASFVLGQAAANTGAAGTTRTGLRGPTGVWTDGKRVAVADSANHRVLIWNSFPTASGQAADIVLGQANFTTGAAAAAGASSLRDPRGVFFDGTRFYVADSGNHRVLAWNVWPSANGQAADLVLGQAAMNGSAAATIAAGLRSPRDVTVSGNALFVSDGGNHRVLVWSPMPAASGSAATFVLGQTNFTTAATPGPTARSLREPQGLAVAGNQLFVADRAQHRVLVFGLNQ